MGLGPGLPPGGPGLPPLPTFPPIIVQGSRPGVDSGAVSTALGAITSFAGNILTYLKGYVDALFGSLFGALHAIFSTIRDWLRQLKDSWLGKLISHIWQRAKTYWLIFKQWQKKIQGVIDTIRRIERQYFDLYIKPILNLIQRLRQALLIFRIFHLRFAERLDNYLAGLEARITKNFLRVYQDINRLSDYINIILDPFGVIHRITFLKSILRTPGGIIAATRAAQDQPLTQDQAKEQQQAEQSVHRDQVAEAWSKRHDVLEEPYFCTFLKEINNELEQLGYFAG